MASHENTGRHHQHRNESALLRLPGEIRNMIYDELMPSIPELWEAMNSATLHSSGRKTTTRFMATCRQMYEESASILYWPLRSRVDPVRIGIGEYSSIKFLGRTFQFDGLGQLDPAVFSAVKRLKALKVSVYGHYVELFNVCAIQDMLFHLLGHLTESNILEEVQIVINMSANCGQINNGGNANQEWRDGSVWRRRLPEELPQGISRRHLVAFFADALCLIHGGTLRTRGSFKLNFRGRTLRPWREIEGRVWNAITHRPANLPLGMPNFRYLSGYFEHLRHLHLLARQTPEFWYQESPFEVLALARIRGNMVDLYRHHGKLLLNLDRLQAQTLNKMYPILAWHQEEIHRMEEMMQLS